MSLYKIVLMSYVEGWIAAIKATTTPGTPIYLEKKIIFNNNAIGHFSIVYLVAKPSIWSEAEQVTLLWQRPVSSEHDNKVFYIWKVATLVS